MEDLRDQKVVAKDSIVYVYVNDGFLRIPREKLLQCTILKEMMNSTKSEILSLKTDTFYTKDNVQTLFACFDKSALIQEIEDTNIVDIFNIAGNLGAPRDIRKKLAWRALDLGHNFLIDGDLKIKSCNEIKIDFDTNATKLDFSCKKMRILLGLERFANKNVTKIDLSFNKLKRVDLELFFKLFPNLKELNINYNKIDQLTVSRTPNNFILNARGNQLTALKDIDSFLLGEWCKFDLARNKFSEEIQKKIEWFARKRSLWNNIKVFYRYNISPVLLIRFLQMSAGSIIGFLSGLGLQLLNSWKLSLQGKSTKFESQFNFLIYGSLLGAVGLGYIYPTLAATLEYKNCKEKGRCSTGRNGHLMCSLFGESDVNFDPGYALYDGIFVQLQSY